MSELLAIASAARFEVTLLLDCGHWVKWTGPAKPPRVGSELRCPACTLPVVLPAPESGRS